MNALCLFARHTSFGHRNGRRGSVNRKRAVVYKTLVEERVVDIDRGLPQDSDRRVIERKNLDSNAVEQPCW